MSANQLWKLTIALIISLFFGIFLGILLCSWDGIEAFINFPVTELTTQSYFLVFFRFAILCLLLILVYTLRIRRKKTEEDLHVSQELFTNTLLNLNEGVIVTDKKCLISFMNKAAEIICGKSIHESLGNHIDFVCNIVDPKTKEKIENPVYDAIRHNKANSFVHHSVFINEDKSIKYINDSSAPIHNDHNEVIAAVWIFRDVTEQTINQQKLEERERLLKDIIDNTNSIIYIKDLEGRYLMINHQLEKIFNFKSNEVIGKESYQNYPEEIALMLREADNKVINENRLISSEQIIQHPDGSFHTYQMTKFPLNDKEGKVYGICGVSTDITESKKNIEMQEKLAMQDVLLKSEIKYTELTENMPNLFFSFDRSLRYTSVNKATEKFAGKKAEEAIGKTIIEALPGREPQFIKEYQKVLDTGIAMEFISEFSFYGKKFAYIVNIYPTDAGISVLMTDITQQRIAEKETLELVNLMQRKNNDLQQFAYIVSHNLRSPIAKIMGLADLYEAEDTENETNKSILDLISNEVKNLDNVIKDMNTIITASDSANESKELVEFKTEFELITLVLDNEIKECNATITSDFTKAPSIISIKTYLYSILYNLLSNAIKFRLEEKLLKITVETNIEGNFICLTVQDNGKGIDIEKNGQKLFGLYKRFHGEKIPGKGIGLNLVRTQIESLGGRVEIQSKPNKGALFKVYFPNLHL